MSEAQSELKPFFEVIVGNPAGEHKHYKIYANGLTEGFEDGDKAVIIVNRIRQLKQSEIVLTEEDQKITPDAWTMRRGAL